MNTFFISSPLDQFEIRQLLGLITPFFDLSFINFTTFSLYSVITLIIILIFVQLADSQGKLVGGRWYIVHEALYDTILNMTRSQIGGSKGGYYFPLLYSLFLFILVANLISMVPYSFALNAHVIFVVSLSFIVWLGVTITGFSIHGLGFFALFVPVGTPLPLVPVLVLIELLSYVARAISLGLRLGANIIAGHLLLNILAGLVFTLMSVSPISFVLGFIPVAGIFAIVCLEFAIACIQAYVFTILAAGYIKDGLYLH